MLGRRLTDCVGDRGLGFVRVGFASIDLELAELGATEAGLRDHAPDGALDEQDWAALADNARGFHLLATDIAGEAGVDFGSFLGAGQDNLVRIDDDDEVTGINVGGENGLVLAAEEARGLNSDLAEDLALGVDHIPLALDFMRLGGKRLHVLVIKNGSETHGVCEGGGKLGSRFAGVNREISGIFNAASCPCGNHYLRRANGIGRTPGNFRDPRGFLLPGERPISLKFKISRARFSVLTSVMAKGYETHQARTLALQGLGKDLARRAKSKCELTGAAGVPLRAYEIPPVAAEPEIDRTLLVSETCLEMLERPERLKGREWQCLAEVVWSELPAVQVVAWRMLNELAKREDWAREVIAEVFLDEEVETWARSEEL